MPNYPKPAEEYDPAWADDLVRELEEHAAELEQPAGTGYTLVANLTTGVKTYDANATTVEELADALGNLIEDLKAKNVIGK